MFILHFKRQGIKSYVGCPDRVTTMLIYNILQVDTQFGEFHCYFEGQELDPNTGFLNELPKYPLSTNPYEDD